MLPRYVLCTEGRDGVALGGVNSVCVCPNQLTVQCLCAQESKVPLDSFAL